MRKSKNLFNPLFFWKKRKAKSEDNISIPHERFKDSDDVTLNDRVQINHEIRLEEARVSSISLARNIPPLPIANATQPHNAEVSIFNGAQNDIHLVKSIVQGHIEDLKNKYSEASETYENTAANREIIEFQIKDDVSSEIAFEKDKIDGMHTEAFKAINEEIDETQNKLKNAKQDANDLEMEFAKTKSAEPSLRKPIVYYFLLLALGILEIPLNRHTFLVMRDDVLTTILSTLLISLAIILSAHYAGKYLRKVGKSYKEKMIILVSIIVPLVISGIVGHIRYEYLLHKDIVILSSFGLGFLNFAIFIVGVVLSYHFSHPFPDLVEQFKAALLNIKKLEKHLSILFQKKSVLEDHFVKEHQAVLAKEEALYRKKRELHFLAPREKVLQLASQNNSVVTAVQSLEQTIVSNFHFTISEFRKVNENRRVDNAQPKYWDNELPKLTLFFDLYELLKPFESSPQKSENIPSSDLEINPVSSPNAKRFLQQVNGLFLILLLSCGGLLVSSCSQTSPPQYSLIYVCADITESYSFSSPVTSHQLLTVAGITPEQNTSNSAEIYLTYLSDISLDRVFKHSLSGGNVLDNPLDRQDELDAFCTSMDSSLKILFTPTEGKSFSRIYPHLSSILNELSASPADKKYLFIYSDMFENNQSQTLSFYTYAENPKLLMESYNEITTAFESFSPLADLSGIQIFILGFPTTDTDDLFVQSRRFWTQFFESKNASVRYSANFNL